MRFQPHRDIELAQRRMRQMLEDFDRTFQQGLQLDGSTYMPRVDISEDDKNLYVLAELPGLTESDVKVTLSEGILSIRGEKKRNEEHRDRNYHRIERTYGEFVRQFDLPENVNEDSISATFANGTLEVTIPKAEPEKPKEREISIGSARNASAGTIGDKSDSSVGENGRLNANGGNIQNVNAKNSVAQHN